MWLMTIFDLPVQTKEQRKEASSFRNHLLDSGFEMVQYSVYMKSCSGKDEAETSCLRIAERVPRHGNIKVLQFIFCNVIFIGISYSQENVCK